MRHRALAAAGLFGILVLGSCGSGGSQGPSDLVLVSHLPLHGESAFPRNGVIRLVFSESVLAESVTDQSVLVRIGGTFQTRPVGTFLVTGNVVEFDPTVTPVAGGNALGFAAGEQVLVKVPLKTAVDGQPEGRFLRSVAGDPITAATGADNFSFVTGAGWIDRNPGPPEVVELDFSPAPDEQGRVLSGAAVTVIFNEPIDPHTFGLGKNVFLTNNTSTEPESVYEKDIPSLVFFDGSLTRYTLMPVFGFGKGPYTIRLGFADPDAETFRLDNPPADLVGNKLANSLFSLDFDTLLDPNAPVFGVVTEDFLTTASRDQASTDALWGNDPEFPQELVGQLITKRNQRVTVGALTALNGGQPGIDNAPGGLGEEDYCPNQNPLVGTDSLIKGGNPPASAGRRQLNLYRAAELGGNGTILRIAWGPDSDATFAATYPGLTMRLGHKKAGTGLVNGATMNAQFDTGGFVTVVNPTDYAVPQAFDVNGGAKNDGYLSWPPLDVYFEYDGSNDLIVDIEAQMGNTFQTIRTFLGVNSTGICNCFNFGGCAVNPGFGNRQMDGVYGGNTADPLPGPGYFNPGPFLHVMEFEMTKLRSDARSIYHDTATGNPDYISPIALPLVQAGGASVALTWSASHDGIVEDVPFTPDINACDGYRYIRWHCALRSNLFTGARARLELLQIPYIIR